MRIGVRGIPIDHGDRKALSRIAEHLRHADDWDAQVFRGNEVDRPVRANRDPIQGRIRLIGFGLVAIVRAWLDLIEGTKFVDSNRRIR